MSTDQFKNPNEETITASLQSVSREEESCPVPSSLPSDTTSPVSSEINDMPPFVNWSQKCGDDVAAQSSDDGVPSPPPPSSVSDSEDEPADDNVSHDTPSGSSNEDGSGGPVCRICHEGDQEEPLASLCSCSGTMGFVHVPCLEQWINQEKVDFCELCGQRFPMVAQPSNVLKFFHWVSQSNWCVQRMFLGSLLFLGMLTMLTACVFFVVHQVSGIEERQRDSPSQWFFHAFLLILITVALSGLYKLMFDRLCDLYALFLAWNLAHPVLRIAPRPSDRSVALART